MNKALKYSIYCALYVGITVSLTWFFFTDPVLLRIENSLYDRYQRYHVIDDDGSSRLKAYQDELDKIFLIDMDSENLDPESGRIDKPKLNEILRALGEQNLEDIDAIFIDYLYTNPTPEDSVLIPSMQKLGEKLVLPYGIETDAVPEQTFGKKPKIYGSGLDSLVYKPIHTGYIDYFSLGPNEELRYLLLEANDNFRSCITELVDLTHPERLEDPVFQTEDKWMEINYLIRNDAGVQKDSWGFGIDLSTPALTAYNGKAIREYASKDVLQSYLKGKNLIFIGLFSSFSTIYERPVDQFKTPVSENMQGATILLNSYLNLVSSPPSYLRRAGLWMIALIGIVLSMLSIFYANWASRFRTKHYLLLIAEQVLTIAGFICITWFLYNCFYIKLAFVPLTLFWVANQRLLNLFERSIQYLKPKRS